ncbi:oligosaccharide flippase family protein [Paraburkholderia caribensis]|uniref:oligosaccharide flippase family protein n=1 Tax=Paraburkholderia caribensis TaxID=75105 RepID=UPI001CB37C8F|nr:oligosaccharide flippase family protein [Paraburkholderia caribensis]CAG9259013.1 membrane hypothetical protein [Paraburkholderia caribensis]
MAFKASCNDLARLDVHDEIRDGTGFRVWQMLRGVSYSVLANVAGLLGPLVTMPYVLRVLGPGAYGLAVYASIISTWITSVLVLGLSGYCARQYSRSVISGAGCGDRELSSLVSLQIVMAIAATVLHAVVISLVIERGSGAIFWIYLAVTAFSCLNVDWFFYVTDRMDVFFWRTLVLRLAALAALFVFVKTKEDVTVYAGISAVFVVLPNLVSFIFVVRRHPLSFDRHAYKRIGGARYFLTNATIGSVYQFADQFLMGMLSTKENLSYLNVCKQIMGIANMVVASASRALMPRAVDAFAHGKGSVWIRKMTPACGAAVVAATLGMWLLGAPLVRLLAGPKFEPASEHMALLAAIFAVTAVAVYIDTQISIPLNCERFTTVSNSFVAIVSIVMLLALFQRLGFVSALVGLLVGETIGVSVMLYLHKGRSGLSMVKQ